MLKLWHCRDARSFRALWALEELGLPYELVLLPFPPRWLEPSFLELNPLGTIPFFTDGPSANIWPTRHSVCGCCRAIRVTAIT